MTRFSRKRAQLAAGFAVAATMALLTPDLKAKPSLFGPPKQQTPEITAPAKTGSASAADRVKNLTMRVDVKVAEGGDIDAAYFDYFKAHKVHPKVVRAHVRRLMSKRANPNRYDEVIATISACIRTGQLQPWMYEALGLAMQLDKRPIDEIERVLMSATDFSSKVNDKLMLAAYLDRIGLEKRALQLFREVGEQHPTRPEAFVQGLKIARRLNDLEGLQWSTVGILRQAWPAKQAKLRQSATWSARATLNRLQEDGRTSEAQAYWAELKEASRRDVEVRVTWEGEADVDMMIEEPAGTVCSYRTPRTTAGGVMLGETHSKVDKLKGDGSTETYVCPEGYEGTYRVLLRQVWGRIPSGKVSVEIRTRDKSGKQVIHKQNYPLGAKDTMVTFDLDKGRRQENLAEHHVARAAQGQLAVNRAILAQQINAVQDPILAQQVATGGARPFVTGITPVVGGNGNVGFRPELTILPEGATLDVTAVISADRRYVRVTPRPVFSQIGDVTTFSVTGEADNSFGNDDDVIPPEEQAAIDAVEAAAVDAAAAEAAALAAQNAADQAAQIANAVPPANAAQAAMEVADAQAAAVEAAAAAIRSRDALADAAVLLAVGDFPGAEAAAAVADAEADIAIAQAIIAAQARQNVIDLL